MTQTVHHCGIHHELSRFMTNFTKCVCACDVYVICDYYLVVVVFIFIIYYLLFIN